MSRRHRHVIHLVCRGLDPGGNRCGETYDEYEVDAARALGWKTYRWPDGLLDAMCPKCGKSDPTTAALCRDLERSIE
jgi:hypothetical protein